MASFEQAKEVLKRCFGHDEFRPEQERAIRAIMGTRDVLAVMSTGAGKSLIYQVPAVALEERRVRHLLLRHDFRDRADSQRAQASRRARRALPRQTG